LWNLTNLEWSVRRSDETTVALGLRTMQSLSPRDVEGGGLASQDQEPATCHRRRRRRVIDMAPSSRQLQACSIHELQNLYEAQETAIHNMTSHLNKLGRAAARAEGRQEFINHLQMVIELHNLADLHFQRASRAFSAALYWHPLLAEAVGEEEVGVFHILWVGG
jgi:hypothetical protein